MTRGDVSLPFVYDALIDGFLRRISEQPIRRLQAACVCCGRNGSNSYRGIALV